MRVDIRNHPQELTIFGKAKEAIANDRKKTHPGLVIGVLGLGTGILLHNAHDYMKAHQAIGLQELVNPGEQFMKLMTDGDLPFRLYNVFMSHLPQAFATEFVDKASLIAFGLSALGFISFALLKRKQQ
ncbi:MAG TPA: hypothetical protein VF189_02430 [Patescibacteria group bacterium]